MARSTPLDAVVQDTLENLIKQFSQELCFYRELIQNALDANTSRIDVSLEYVPGSGREQGSAVVHIDDFGEGMNRQIIDTQLTRLFSSTKERDFTKIGKFGVGFVSVFAIGPGAVIVDTGRDGEYWRVLFHPDRTFDRIRLDRPVDGTKIQVIRQMPEKEFKDFVERSRRTVVYWCRHSDVPIIFDGKAINQPFDMNLPLKVRHEREGTEVVLGLTDDAEPFFGFYNGGITLLEGRRAYFPGVTFKIRSRYLEHTLTRDNVIQDRNYDKAMAIVGELARAPLLTALFDALEASLASGDMARHELLMGLATYRIASVPFRSPLARKPVIPLVNGETCSLAELRSTMKERKGLPFDGEENDLTAFFPLAAKAQPASAVYRLLETMAGTPPVHLSQCYAAPRIVEPPAGFPALSRSLLEIVKSLNSTLEEVHPASFAYRGSSIEPYPFILQDRMGDASPIDRENERGIVRGGPAAFTRALLRRGPRHLVLNTAHPYVIALSQLAAEDSRLAAYLFCRVLYLRDGLAPAVENPLLEIALRSMPRRKSAAPEKEPAQPASGDEKEKRGGASSEGAQ